MQKKINSQIHFKDELQKLLNLPLVEILFSDKYLISWCSKFLRSTPINYKDRSDVERYRLKSEIASHLRNKK